MNQLKKLLKHERSMVLLS